MFTMLFFEKAGEPPTQVHTLGEILEDLGVRFEAPENADYRPGTWRDPATMAMAMVDLGEMPLVSSDSGGDQPPTNYLGWQIAPLAIHLPIVGPHWRAVEGLAFIARLLERMPDLAPLDAEDTRVDDASEAGPFAYDRPRALVSWELQREAHLLGRDVPSMVRGESIALWRYRRERALGKAAHPELHWPDCHVLLDRATGAACSACLIWDPSEGIALPPVSLAVVRVDNRTNCVPADILRQGEGLARGLAGALLLPAGLPDVAAFFDQMQGPERFAALDDVDWQD